MADSKSWPQVKREWPDKPCVKASVFVPVDGRDDGLEVSMEGVLPKGIAMVLVASALTNQPLKPETEAYLLDLAKRMMFGEA